MMSLTKTSVPAVAWKQYRFKTKIYAANLITLLAAQLLGLLLSLRGVGFSGIVPKLSPTRSRIFPEI